MRISDWSSDVCSSDLRVWPRGPRVQHRRWRPDDDGRLLPALCRFARPAAAAADCNEPGARGADAGDDVVHRGIKASADPALARRVALYAAVSESGSRTAELSVVLKIPARRSSFDEHDARVQDIRSEEHTSELQSLMR